MRPHPGTTDEFIYSFDIRFKGNPANATVAAWNTIPGIMEQLPAGLADAMVGGYKALLSEIAQQEAAKKLLQERERDVREENRRLMEAVDAQEKLNEDLRAKIAEAEAERGRLASIRKDWKLRINNLVAQRVEARRCDAVVEANRLRRTLSKVEGELKALKSALAVVGEAFKVGSER